MSKLSSFRFLLRLAFLAIQFIGSVVRAESGRDALVYGFKNPPPQARPLVYWHWINGNVTKAGIRADLEDMKRVGIAGVQMFDVSMYTPAGPARYGSDEWNEDVQYAIRTAKELGLEFYVMNCSGWSASGGPWVTPEQSMKQLVWSELDVEGGHELNKRLDESSALLNYYRDIAVLAVPANHDAQSNSSRRQSKPTIKNLVPATLVTNGNPILLDRVIDLTASMKADGTIHATLPSGSWTIIRFGYTATGSKNHPATAAGEGLEIDKLDADAVTFQFDQALGKIIGEAGPLVGQSFVGIHMDSFEAGFQNWTGSFPEQFRKLKGYDLIHYLPVLTGRVVGNRDQSEAVLRDFQGAISEMVAQNYFGTMQRLAHNAGLKVSAEAYGGPLNPFLCNQFVDMPMAEFWLPEEDSGGGPDDLFLKHISSTANIFGRSIVAAEAFTAKPESGPWLATPATLKPVGDRAFIAGINRFVLHSYVHQPYSDIAPGFTLGRYGTHFGRLNSWWPYAGAWIDYLSRCQFLLQQGKTVQDVCYLVDDNYGWHISTQTLAVPSGHDYGFCDIRNLNKMVWGGGVFRLPQGLDYRILILPAKWACDTSTLRRLKEWVEAGASIAGPRPRSPAGLLDLRDRSGEWNKLVEELWDKTRARFIRSDFRLSDLLEKQDVPPDFEYTATPTTGNIKFAHRRSGQVDFYFLSNQTTNSITLKAKFHSGNRVPELWDAVNGRIVDATTFETKAGFVSLPIQLGPSGSVFIAFRRTLPANWIEGVFASTNALVNRVGVEAGSGDCFFSTDSLRYSIQWANGHRQDLSVPQPVVKRPVLGPWKVSFPTGSGAPQEILLKDLAPLNLSQDPGVRYFSGVASYSTTFTLDEKNGGIMGSNICCFLDLGRVCDIAQVRINGQDVGISWISPFEFEITSHLRSGENLLEIGVANRWINRLIGDEQLPADAQYAEDGTEFTRGRLLQFPDWLGKPDKVRERKRLTFATWHHFNKESPLVDSGLLGPVELRFVPIMRVAPTFN